MARLFGKGDEKQVDMRTTDDPRAADELDTGVIDEAHDDLHREMKPRQLSKYGKFPVSVPVSVFAPQKRRLGDSATRRSAPTHSQTPASPVALHQPLLSRSRISQALMAIAGAIGTGLILGTGGALRNGGPASLLLAYLLMGYVVYVVMVALGEMGAWLPHKKAFSGYASRFVDPAMGFATGWNYFFKYVIVLPNNLTASGIILQFWRPDINVSVWIVVFGVAIVALNLIHVSFFGEAEFWMSLVKALVIAMLILICFIVALGGGPNHHRTGFWYWKDPGAFAPYLLPEQPSLAKFLGFWASVVQATFAYLGTELVGVAFGETPNPRKNVPRAVNQTLLRIVLFYLGGVIVLGMAVPYNDPDLKVAASSKASGAASPFVIAAKNAGIARLADAVNGLLLVFTVSAANSDIYLASRSVWALAKDRQAPQLFHRTNKRGVPIPAVVLSSLFIVLGFMNATKGSDTVFGYFVSLVTVFGALNWVSVLVSYICMQRGMKAQGIKRSTLPYRNFLLPWSAYIALPITILVILFNGFAAFIPTFKVDKFITAYIGIPVYLLNIFWWKVFKKTKMVKPEEMDLQTNRRDE